MIQTFWDGLQRPVDACWWIIQRLLAPMPSTETIEWSLVIRNRQLSKGCHGFQTRPCAFPSSGLNVEDVAGPEKKVNVGNISILSFFKVCVDSKHSIDTYYYYLLLI